MISTRAWRKDTGICASGVLNMRQEVLRDSSVEPEPARDRWRSAGRQVSDLLE